jgi:hypothetical protein
MPMHAFLMPPPQIAGNLLDMETALAAMLSVGLMAGGLIGLQRLLERSR